MDLANTDAGAVETLGLLSVRLHRLEFLLHGSSDSFGAARASSSTELSVVTQLAELEDRFRRLASKNEVVEKLLGLYSRYPELFLPASDDQVPETLDPSVCTSVVFAHVSSFAETVSRLNSLKDLSLPPASDSAELLQLQPRLAKVKDTQTTHARQVAELRAKSAKLLERWVEVGLVGQGEVWAEWEERLRVAQRSVRRAEIRREKEFS